MYNPCTDAKMGYWAPVGTRYAQVQSKAVSPTIGRLGQTLTTATSGDQVDQVRLEEKRLRAEAEAAAGPRFEPTPEQFAAWEEEADYALWKYLQRATGVAQSLTPLEQMQWRMQFHWNLYQQAKNTWEEEQQQLEKEAYGATMAATERERLEAEFAAERQRLEEAYSGYTPPGEVELAIPEPKKTPYLLILGGAAVAYYALRKK